MTQLQHGISGGGHQKVEAEPTLVDENLTIADNVLDALAQDPRTAKAVIEVIYERGVLTLSGDVETEVIHEAAAEIAAKHAKVFSVVNALEVRPKDHLIHSLSPTRLLTY